MRQYIALIHKDADSDFGVSFPDFPGCVTAGVDLDDARRMAEEALALHLAGMAEDEEPIREPSSLEVVMAERENRDAVAILVKAPPATAKAVRVNMTLPEDELELIDKFAAEQGYTRSGFLLHAAKQAIASAEAREAGSDRRSSASWPRKSLTTYCCVRRAPPFRTSMIAPVVNQVIKSDPSYIEQAKANIAEALGEVGMLRKRATEGTEAAKAAAARRREDRISPKP